MTDCNNEDNIVQQNRLTFVTNRAETLDEIAARSVFRSSLPDCVDPTNQIQTEKRRFLQTTRPIEVNGVYTSAAVQALTDDFEENFSASRRTGTPIDRAVSDFGDSFYDSLNDLNRFLNGRDLGEFPTLNDRISQFPEVTPIEYAEFIREFLYTPTVTNVNITFNPTLLLNQLDQFYVKNFTQSAIGGFCALMPQVFGAINQFFTAIGFLSQGIGGIIAALRERAIQELMRRISQEVAKIIDSTVGKVLGIITNFSIETVFSDITTFVNDQVIGRLVALKASILTFFTPENLQRIRKRVEDLITYAVGVFQNPSFEEIQFLVYRFCSFASQVEALINGLKDPLTFFAGNFRSTISNLRTASNINTARAVQAGAIRYTDAGRIDQINTAEEEAIRRGGLLPPLSPGLAGLAPTWEEVESGRAVFRVANNTSFSDFTGLGTSGRDPGPILQRRHEGYTKLEENIGTQANQGILYKLFLIQREFGQIITITSGFRSLDMNRFIYRNSPDPTEHDGSYHVSSRAVDIQWDRFNSRVQDISSIERLLSIAIRYEIGGIGVYNSFVHLDVGSRRTFRASDSMRDFIRSLGHPA